MAKIRPFRAWRPAPRYAPLTAALPYDVYSSDEAREKVRDAPLSFLNIDRAETQFAPGTNIYSDAVYEKASALLRDQMASGIYIQERRPCYYLYELALDGHVQDGLVACVSVDDYVDGTIKKHEKTLPPKEVDRIRHIDACSAQTGPVFLAYHHTEDLHRLADDVKRTAPIYDFVTDDRVRQRCWRIGDDALIQVLTENFANIGSLYIADGHHRAASAARVCLMRRAAHQGYDGSEEFNSFLAVLFPDNQLHILPYHRAVRDLNGHTPESFLKRVGQDFFVEPSDSPVMPEKPYVYGCYLDGRWYRLTLKTPDVPRGTVERLDVSVLQDLVLAPILGVEHPSTDPHIAFVGGVRDPLKLEQCCQNGMAVAFSLFPVSIGQLFDTADAGLLMPPKSTWFEPKLRSGLFIHEIER